MATVRVLVVDDSPELLNLIKSLLERSPGIQVFTAEDGLMALRRFSEVQPDLVILDVWMPGMNGIEVARHIRRTSSVPILFLSAVGTPDIVARGLETGAEGFITKPFSPRAFLSKVYDLLQNRPAGSVANNALSDYTAGGET
ncbi:MAG: response regulator [Anaerolineae bacterium]|nr:response regulator [Anaerolineae bacterium]